MPNTNSSSSQPPHGLEDLRKEIDAIDTQIVELLARRHSKVQNVVNIKKSLGLPVYHPAREEDLISQRREQAKRAGLDPDHVEELYRCIVRQSRVRQTVHISKQAVRPSAKILIVGGRGRMGQYFGRWFGGAGYEVRILDIGDWPRVDELCSGIDLALVCVPIQATPDVIRQLGPHLPKTGVLADITSLKQEPLTAMLSAHSGPVIGLHPLFGPSTTSMDKQIVVATPGRDEPACAWLIEQLTSWGNIIERIDAAEHDRIMDLVQGLRHFATFAFGRYMAQRKVPLEQTLEMSSPIYRLELGMVGRLFAQDAQLYANIIFASPQRRAFVLDFIESLVQSRALLEKSDTAKFCREFQEVADWFGPFCEQAMRESSFLIDKLVERF
jgi:chorismate mutase / prephenate dehydrogenase